MAINFEKKTPDWENVGAEPDAELKKGGFRAGYKPPAAYFNWFFNRISASVKELQEKLAANLKELAFKDKVGNGDITDVAAGKVTQDSTHRMITDIERINWNDANSKKHTHGNKSTVDKLTETLLTNWTAAYTHVSNKSNPHGVTKAQVGLGNVPNAATNDQTPTYTQADTLGNLVSGEKLTVSMGKIMKAIADLIAHKADAVLHVTAAERTKWNAVTNKVDKVSGKQLSTNDYTTAEKNKLAGIAAGAEVNVQPDWSQTNAAADDYIKNRPSSFPPSGHTHDERYYTETEMNTKLGAKVTSVGGDISNTNVSEFTTSTASFPVPAAGDTTKGAFGKIAKFFGDIRNTATGACFIGQIVNNCVTNRADLPLSAAQGKVLMDLYTVLNTNLISRSIVSTYSIPDREGVSTNPEYITPGFHNVTKYSNGACIYSIQAYVYPTALTDCIIGNIPVEYMHIKQDVYSYCWDMTGNRFLLIRITPQGIIRLQALDGKTVPQSQVRMRGSIVF